ncbi:AhpC/TSA family protein [Salisediminibacterium beveridgei]|uniref:AhpC/TSA antioxidant enzyme n=1 Tax=Salisediminibacterium beveridgei TaxID=632773 RepID=A0A1D7QS05_9BACI|nr:AhpC/TSA family protein [Salisediminibacterium beveridgei]AOM81796.1 hypothetical protein BBEV_0402 [Salisediminibacterium beveridgei]
MRQHHEELTPDDGSLLVIAPSKGQMVNQFNDLFGPFPFPIYGDPARSAYKGMNLKTMGKAKLLTMAGAAFVSGKVKGFIPDQKKQKDFVMKSMKTQDVYIQGGAWLFDDNKNVAYKHIDASPDDHAKIPTLIQEVNNLKQHQ